MNPTRNSPIVLRFTLISSYGQTQTITCLQQMSRTSGIVPPTILRYSEQTNMAVSEFASSSKLVPSIRICTCNAATLRGSSSYVLYWIIADRRLSYNFAPDRALEYCRELRKPLVIFEALRCGYR